MYYAIFKMDNNEEIIFEYNEANELIETINTMQTSNFIFWKEKGKENSIILNTSKIIKIELRKNIDWEVSNFIL